MATLESRIYDLLQAIGTDWKDIQADVGVMANLETAATNLVAAINEVKATADAAVAGTAPDGTTTVKGIVELATDSEALAMAATDLVLTPGNLAAVRNATNGLAGLDGTGKVAAAQLPSYVDDVLEYANLAALPGTGVTGVMYVTLDTNKTYRWSGTVYVEISASPGSTDAVSEGATNLYFTNTRADGRVTTLVGDPDTDLAAIYAAAKA
jgi:hypothetical protein